MNAATTHSANLYDSSRRKPSRRPPIQNSLGPRKLNFASAKQED